MSGIDTDAVPTDMVMPLVSGIEHRRAVAPRTRAEASADLGLEPQRRVWIGVDHPGIVDDRAWQIRRIAEFTAKKSASMLVRRANSRVQEA
jgi:hypothetical protein